MKKVLITDSLFIQTKHEQMLHDAGIEFERLDLPAATEKQLIEKIVDKDGYILGGIEQVTEDVIVAGKKLEAIVFTGIGYKGFIPAWEAATKHGIAIANSPDAPTYAVAEWAITMALAMNRNIFDLGRLGKKKFVTSTGFEGLNFGFVGFGRIGQQIAKMIQVFQPSSMKYFSPHRHDQQDVAMPAVYSELSGLLAESDIVFLGVSDDAGENFFDAKKIAAMKNGSLLVSFVNKNLIDTSALYADLQQRRIRAVSDNALGDMFNDLPLETWYCFNGSNAFNTHREITLTSDTVTQSIINILNTGNDSHIVNPEFRNYIKS